jgi:hypothetical protein
MSDRERPMYSTTSSSVFFGTLPPVNRVSILTVGTTKRKAENLGDESEEAKRKRPRAPQPPIVGERPILEFLVYRIDGSDKTYRACVLPDSGSNTFIMSHRFSLATEVPKVKRDNPVPVTDFAGNIVPGIGEVLRGCTGHRLWVAIVRKWE